LCGSGQDPRPLRRSCQGCRSARRHRYGNLPPPCQRPSPRWWHLSLSTSGAGTWTAAGMAGISGWCARAVLRSRTRLASLPQHRRERKGSWRALSIDLRQPSLNVGHHEEPCRVTQPAWAIEYARARCRVRRGARGGGTAAGGLLERWRYVPLSRRDPLPPAIGTRWHRGRPWPSGLIAQRSVGIDGAGLRIEQRPLLSEGRQAGRRIRQRHRLRLSRITVWIQPAFWRDYVRGRGYSHRLSSTKFLGPRWRCVRAGSRRAGCGSGAARPRQWD
jgi:hypothetical protein